LGSRRSTGRRRPTAYGARSPARRRRAHEQKPDQQNNRDREPGRRSDKHQRPDSVCHSC
jgi:hypothetical protein